MQSPQMRTVQKERLRRPQSNAKCAFVQHTHTLRCTSSFKVDNATKRRLLCHIKFPLHKSIVRAFVAMRLEYALILFVQNMAKSMCAKLNDKNQITVVVIMEYRVIKSNRERKVKTKKQNWLTMKRRQYMIGQQKSRVASQLSGGVVVEKRNEIFVNSMINRDSWLSVNCSILIHGADANRRHQNNSQEQEPCEESHNNMINGVSAFSRGVNSLSKWPKQLCCFDKKLHNLLLLLLLLSAAPIQGSPQRMFFKHPHRRFDSFFTPDALPDATYWW